MKTTISPGNTKLGKIPNVSMTPIKSCGNASECKDDCYALQPYKMYPNVRKSWDGNFEMAKSDPDQYFKDIHAYLNPVKLFRWHVSGDILDQNYFFEMISTALANPDTNFMVLTKMYHIVNHYKAGLPDNMSVILSVWPGLEYHNPHNLPLAFMDDETETRIFNATECEGTCEKCQKCWYLNPGENVVFKKH